mgnify:CR=1 FL=1
MANIANLDVFPIPMSVGTLGEESRELNAKLCEDSFKAFDEVEVEDVADEDDDEDTDEDW